MSQVQSREGIRFSTPPIPSSSPLRSSSSMDLSPLPHKVPVLSLAQMLAAQAPSKVEEDPMPTTTIVTPKIERKPLAL
jgi:hypothetical protein